MRVAKECDWWMKPEGEKSLAALHCSCEQKRRIWGEFWWVGKRHEWVFFDDQDRSETYTERRLTHCPACGRRLERKNLLEGTYPAYSRVREPASDGKRCPAGAA